MKLEINKRGNKDYYDEFLYVMSKYNKIGDNPCNKIHKISFFGGVI